MAHCFLALIRLATHKGYNMSTSSQNGASTNGWDTVFAIDITQVNSAIANEGAFPTSFDCDVTSDNISANGTFSAWQITTGGSDTLIKMALPLSNVIVNSPTSANPSQNSNTTIASGTCNIEVFLEYLEDDVASGDTNTQKLVIQNTAPQGQTNAVNVTSIDYGSVAVDEFVNGALQELLLTWLNANIGQFTHIFTLVDLSQTADSDSFQWLKPTSVAYAYADMTTQQSGILGVLSMTENRPSTGLAAQINPNALPSGSTASLLISGPRILSEILLPSIPNVFAGSQASDFSLSSTGDSIVNANTTTTFTTTADENGNTHTATIDSLLIQISGTQLNFNVTSWVQLSPGIQAWCTSEVVLDVTLGSQTSGTSGEQTLKFNTVSNNTSHFTHESEGVQITKEIISIAAVAATVVALFVTDGAAFAAACLVIGLVSGTTMITPAAIELAGKGDAPCIDGFVLNATTPIQWGDTADFVLSSCSLNESLQLAGSLTAAS